MMLKDAARISIETRNVRMCYGAVCTLARCGLNHEGVQEFFVAMNPGKDPRDVIATLEELTYEAETFSR